MTLLCPLQLPITQFLEVSSLEVTCRVEYLHPGNTPVVSARRFLLVGGRKDALHYFFRGLVHLVLPHAHYPPTQGVQKQGLPPIAGHVLRQFGIPELIA